jgi:VanZ family protein
MKTRRRAASFLTVACVLIWAAAAVLTHLPRRRIPVYAVSDKLLHFVGYFVLGAFLLGTIWARRGRLRPFAFGAAAFGLCYAGVDELTQPWVGRSAAWGDFLADAGGFLAAAAVMLAVEWGRQRSTGKRTAPQSEESVAD